jgi:hypothetical protein
VTATEGTPGVLEIGTQAELNAGTATDKIATPDKLAAYAPPWATVTLDSVSDKVVVVDASDSSKLKLAAPGLMGKLLQTVAATPITSQDTLTTTVPNDDTVPSITEGDEVFSQALTASAATNLLRFTLSLTGAGDATGQAVISLYKDSTHLRTWVMNLVSANQISASHVHTVLAGDTSAHTYSVREGPAAGQLVSVYLNGNSAGRKFGGGCAAEFSIQEMKP